MKNARQIELELMAKEIKKTLNFKNNIKLKDYIENQPFKKTRELLESNGIKPAYLDKVKASLKTLGIDLELKTKGGRPINRDKLLKKKQEIENLLIQN